MNTENESLVREFLSGFGPTLDDYKTTFRKYFADDVEWESVGGTPHIGLTVSVDHLDQLNTEVGMEYAEIELLNIASVGDVVLTERIDRMFAADGRLLHTWRIMGTFVIRNGRISRYTDYYDSLGTARAFGRI